MNTTFSRNLRQSNLQDIFQNNKWYFQLLGFHQQFFNIIKDFIHVHCPSHRNRGIACPRVAYIPSAPNYGINISKNNCKIYTNSIISICLFQNTFLILDPSMYAPNICPVSQPSQPPSCM